MFIDKVYIISAFCFFTILLNGTFLQAETEEASAPVSTILHENISQDENISMFNTIAIDIIVPGGGHFYRESYITGGVFAVLKMGGAWLCYYYYREWDYSRSLYFSAKKANKSIDPHHELYFAEPNGSYKTVKEYKREYDAAAQRITFAALGNAIVYAASILINYHAVRSANEKNLPSFDAAFRISPETSEEILYFTCYHRI